MPSPVVFVTGAGRGVGRAIACRFAADGYAVAITGRSHTHVRETAADLEGTGVEALALICDVTARDDVARAVALTEQRLGPIDVLVNNAGIAESAPFVATDDDIWDRTLAVNLTGTYNCMRAIAPGMFERRHGRIINIASMAGLKVLPQIGAYAMSKAAVVQMTKAMALEWGRFEINVNAICPGYIDTEINHHHWSTEQGQKLMNMLPRKRVGQPQDLDALIVLLASSQSHFMNGAVIAADDGFGI